MKPKDSEYLKFTFADLRRAEKIDILENGFAEICCFFKLGACDDSAAQTSDQNINKNHLKKLKNIEVSSMKYSFGSSRSHQRHH